MTGIRHLRVLIANERQDHLELLAEVVSGLGHEVVAREITVEGVGPATARVRPDVALVGLGLSSKHALSLVSGIVREAFCPVIAVTPSHDPAWVDEAAKRGVYAYIIDGHPKELQSAIEITLRRFAEYQSLHGPNRALCEPVGPRRSWGVDRSLTRSEPPRLTAAGLTDRSMRRNW